MRRARALVLVALAALGMIEACDRTVDLSRTTPDAGSGSGYDGGIGDVGPGDGVPGDGPGDGGAPPD